MSAKQFREALSGAGSKGVSHAEFAALAGIEQGSVGKIVWPFVNRGEVNSTEDGKRGTVYTLVKGYAAERKTAAQLPVKRRAKKKRGHKNSRKPARRTMRDIADRLAAARAADKALIEGLAMDNMIEAGIALAAVVRAQVEGLEDNPALMSAVEQQERAAKLARAINPPCPF